MRHPIYVFLAGFLLAMPAAAQPSSNDGKAPSNAPQGQAAKDSKATDQTAKSGQAADPAAQPAPEVKEDPMANFNVLGNAVGDGLGVPR
ncbi:MAG TPA: hypothetical protein VNW15_16120 [Rhizomicrobium sp.]|nr:hypothetical protein [Rhizomicrobium sp.]